MTTPGTAIDEISFGPERKAAVSMRASRSRIGNVSVNCTTATITIIRKAEAR